MFLTEIISDGLGINRIRLEFKVKQTFPISNKVIRINRIRLEFKGKTRMKPKTSSRRINRIRLEFKAYRNK